ncbi:MAG: hypothetical protein ACE5F9_14865, partial [Phycisphaerae bacterium]
MHVRSKTFVSVWLTGFVCLGATAAASAVPPGSSRTTVLDAAHQGEGNKGVSFRPTDTTGGDAFFVLTARTRIDPSDPFGPDAVGETGTVRVDKNAKGTGVQDINGGGSKGISGGGGHQNEELIFTFDAPVPAASILLDLTGVDFSERSDDDDPVIFISSSGSTTFDHTIFESEIQSAFTSTGSHTGRVDFAQFTSLPVDLAITAFKLRETHGHLAVIQIVNALGVTG